MERLQKVIAQSGYCSRRKAEELILKGKVKVNGKVVDELGTKVARSDEISVSGQVLEKENRVYYVLNKPKGYICSAKDQFDRPAVVDLIHEGERVYPVGRLDFDTSGVLLMTNDGAFANKMMHPRYHVGKTYEINLQGMLSADDLQRLRTGLKTKEGSYLPAKVVIRQKDYTRNRMQLEMTIQEGKNHQVKKMMEALGHQVRRLHRKSFGNITTEGLKPGQYRKLKKFEYLELMKQADQGAAQ